jgi:hypothetical protein
MPARPSTRRQDPRYLIVCRLWSEFRKSEISPLVSEQNLSSHVPEFRSLLSELSRIDQTLRRQQ